MSTWAALPGSGLWMLVGSVLTAQHVSDSNSTLVGAAVLCRASPEEHAMLLCREPQLRQDGGIFRANIVHAGETQADATQEGEQAVSAKQEQAVVAGEKQTSCPLHLLLKCSQCSRLDRSQAAAATGAAPAADASSVEPAGWVLQLPRRRPDAAQACMAAALALAQHSLPSARFFPLLRRCSFLQGRLPLPLLAGPGLARLLVSAASLTATSATHPHLEGLQVTNRQAALCTCS